MPDFPTKVSLTHVIHFLCEKKDPQAEPDFAFVKKLPAKANIHYRHRSDTRESLFLTLFTMSKNHHKQPVFGQSCKERRLLGPAACKVNQKTALI